MSNLAIISSFLVSFFIHNGVHASSMTFGKPIPSDNFLTEEAYQEQLKTSKKSSTFRKVATIDRLDYAETFNDDFKNLSSELIGGHTWKDGKQTATILPGVRTETDLAILVAKYNNDINFNKLSIQSKWVAAQLALLLPWRGFFFRARPLMEDSDAPFVHSFIVGWLRNANAGVNAFVPTPQWVSGFDFVAKPYVGMLADIKTDNDLYFFVKNELLPSLQKFNTRMNNIVYATVNGERKINPEFRPFYFDNKLIYSTSKIVDEQDRYVVMGRGEVHSVISSANLTISSLHVALAYNWNGLLKTINGVATVMGFNNLLSSNPDKMTAKDRVSIVRNARQLFRIIPKTSELPDGGATWTRAAYPWFREGVRQGRIAWNFTKNEDSTIGNQFPLLDPRTFIPFTRTIDTSFENISHLIEGHGVRSSLVDGQEIQVNFQAIYNNPPEDLKAFLATGFEEGPKSLVEPITRKEYRNYKYGNPKTWNLGAYLPYFPDIDQKDIPKAARILSQSWGANILGAALFPVLF